MSGILAAAQSGTCCCRAVVAPCSNQEARAAMLREDENGVPFFGEFLVSFVGSLTITTTYTCSGWVNAASSASVMLPDVILRNSTQPFFGNVGAVQVSPPANAGIWTATYGARLENWIVNCCQCVKDIPQPPPCSQNCPASCVDNLGMIVRQHGNPLAPTCPGEQVIYHPFCVACTEPGRWAYSEWFENKILSLNYTVSNTGITASNWPQGILCGSQQSQGIIWTLKTGVVVERAICPDGSIATGGASSILGLTWTKPCCNPGDGPVGVYLPSPSMPQSGTFTSSDGCQVSVITSTFPQGFARVTRIAE